MRKCPGVPNDAQMQTEINSMLKTRQQKPTPTWKDRFLSLFGHSIPINSNIKSVSLDGFRMSDLNPYDLEVISRLTMDRDSARSFWKSLYPIEQKQINGVTQIQRKCLTATCVDRGLVTRSLSAKNSNPTCSDALCASQRIFGEKRGVKILWAYLKYGTNLSPYSDVNADPTGFDQVTLNAALLAMSAVPDHLKDATIKDTGFYRFLKGSSLAIYGDSNVLANANGAVFDGMDRISFSEKIATFTHELGHRSAYLNRNNLDDSEAWRTASGWQSRADRRTINNSTRGWVSRYAKTNPAEDYAETYTLYRFSPARLKQISPKRYEYMKVHVFKGIEYDQNICQGQIKSRATSVESSKPKGAAR